MTITLSEVCREGTMNGRRMSIVLAVFAVVLAFSAVALHSDADGAEPLGVQESIGEYTITFTVPSGVTYDIVDRGADSVSFTVSGEAGLTLNPSTVEVSADGSVLEPVQGIYTIENILSDVSVDIEGDFFYSSDPGNPPAIEEFPLWVVPMVFAVIFAVAAVAVWVHGGRSGAEY